MSSPLSKWTKLAKGYSLSYTRVISCSYSKAAEHLIRLMFGLSGMLSTFLGTTRAYVPPPPPCNPLPLAFSPGGGGTVTVALT